MTYSPFASFNAKKHKEAIGKQKLCSDCRKYYNSSFFKECPTPRCHPPVDNIKEQS